MVRVWVLWGEEGFLEGREQCQGYVLRLVFVIFIVFWTCRYWPTSTFYEPFIMK